MKTPLGEKLLEEQVVSKEQLDKALERQRLYGHRLGHNLVALGYLSPEELNSFFNRCPKPPKTVEDTGLSLSFIADLTLKHILFMGEFQLSDVAKSIKLPVSVVEPAIELLRREKLIEVKGATQFIKSSFQFKITDQGKTRAANILDVCRYCGPAPVPLDSYCKMVEMQTIKNIVVSEQAVKKAFSHLTLNENMLKRLGPAISAGHPMFIYGPPGNGKTTIAETISKVLPGTVYTPYAVIVGGQIINVFDSVNHIPARSKTNDAELDQRWVETKRPVIMTGGELTLDMLELRFDPIAKTYEAPLQMKANNGIFVVDDFGRHQIDPQDLLNRWIVSLEKNIDFLSLHTGMKFTIPFNQLVLFSTNMEPKSLVDEAFLRRIRYKIKIDHPTEKEYEKIFAQVCEENGIEFRKDVFDYLINHYYKRLCVEMNACQPRDLIDHIVDDSRYFNCIPELTKETVDRAWENYFLER